MKRLKAYLLKRKLIRNLTDPELMHKITAYLQEPALEEYNV